MIQNPEGYPNALQNLERFQDNRFTDDDEVPGMGKKAIHYTDQPVNFMMRANHPTRFDPATNLKNFVQEAPANIKNTLGNFKNRIGEGITSILDNTIMGKIMAGFDATNPRAVNYNPALQGQIDFMKEQGMYGTNPTSGLNQIRGGVLSGKNLQSIGGLNDLGAMYDKQIDYVQGVYENLENQWGKTLTEDELETKKTNYYNKFVKPAIIEKQMWEKENQKNIDDRIAIEKDRAGTAPQRRAGKGATHMSRGVDQGGLGISAAQAQSVSDANRAAGMSGWGLADGGRVYLNLGGLARLL
jgi:hypothetical protein